MTWMKASCVMSLHRCPSSHRFELRLWGYGTTSMVTSRPGGVSSTGVGHHRKHCTRDDFHGRKGRPRISCISRTTCHCVLLGPPGAEDEARREALSRWTSHRPGHDTKRPTNGSASGRSALPPCPGHDSQSASVPSRQDGTGQPVETTRKKDSLSTAKSEQASPTSSTGAPAHPSRCCRGGGRRQRIGTICAMNRAHSALRLAETRSPRAGHIWLLLGASRPRGALSSLWIPARLMLPRLRTSAKPGGPGQPLEYLEKGPCLAPQEQLRGPGGLGRLGAPVGALSLRPSSSG
jgi:hypothetical protein